MFPNIKREKFSHHIYTEMQIPLLKQAAIYGANGAGKSNFVKALIFLREFILHDDFLKGIDLDDYRFQLTGHKSPAVSFEIEFLHREQYYIYSAGICKQEISEKLFISGLGKSEDELLFERNGHSVTSAHLQNDDSAKQLLSMNPQSSLLPLNMRFPVLSNDDVKTVYDWFSEQLEIIVVNSTIPALIHLLHQKPEIRTFANKVFESAGIGIKGIDISNIPFEEWTVGSKNDRNVLNITVQEVKKTVQELLFDQFGQAGYHQGMKISAQSDGTVRLLTLIPALYDAIYERKTVVVDEIDNSIHPNLLFELIRFYAENKKSNGQLIFTTHTTRLLNQEELLRPDEVWLTEKFEGNTRMFSLNDFKLSDALNLENSYLDGRYGAVPVVEELSAE
jgi:AAA15 family ATPase/GTPase